VTADKAGQGVIAKQTLYAMGVIRCKLGDGYCAGGQRNVNGPTTVGWFDASLCQDVHEYVNCRRKWQQ